MFADTNLVNVTQIAPALHLAVLADLIGFASGRVPTLVSPGGLASVAHGTHVRTSYKNLALREVLP